MTDRPTPEQIALRMTKRSDYAGSPITRYQIADVVRFLQTEGYVIVHPDDVPSEVPPWHRPDASDLRMGPVQ